MWHPHKKNSKPKPPPSQEQPPMKKGGKGQDTEELDDKDTVRGKLIANEVLAKGQRKGKRDKKAPSIGTGYGYGR